MFIPGTRWCGARQAGFGAGVPFQQSAGTVGSDHEAVNRDHEKMPAFAGEWLQIVHSIFETCGELKDALERMSKDFVVR